MISISLLLGKGVYSYKYINNLEKSNEISLPKKEHLYSHLKMETLLMQIKRTQKEFVKILK